jgi:hypothetical protein
MRRRTVVITLGFMIFGIAWYLFRPELAFIDKPVKEEFPRGTQVEATSQGTSPVVLPRRRGSGNSLSAPNRRARAPLHRF